MLEKLKRRFRPLDKRSALWLAVLVLAIGTVIGGTWALLSASTSKVDNEFTPGKVTCEIPEIVEDNVKKSVKVKNTGNTDAYIRAAVIGNTVDDEGGITGAMSDLDEYFAGKGWVKDGNYYYWTKPVAPGKTTEELLKSGKTIDLEGLQVTILAEAIQAKGTDGSSKAVVSAWGVDPETLAEN